MVWPMLSILPGASLNHEEPASTMKSQLQLWRASLLTRSFLPQRKRLGLSCVSGPWEEGSPSSTAFLAHMFGGWCLLMNMILNCFWMGFLLFLPAYRHSPGGIIVLMLKNKRNRFLSLEVSVFHTAVPRKFNRGKCLFLECGIQQH